MSFDEVLDELHMKLYDACKLRNWNVIQTSSSPSGVRTFIVWIEKRRAKVVVTGAKVPPFTGDVTLTSDTLPSNIGVIAATVEGAMVQRAV